MMRPVAGAPFVSLAEAGGRGVSPAGVRAQAAGGGDLARAARDFEAVTIGQLLAPMFDTVDSARGAFGGGAAEAAWKPMLVDAIARQVAAHGGLGFAAPVYRSLLRAQESEAADGVGGGRAPATALQGPAP